MPSWHVSDPKFQRELEVAKAAVFEVADHPRFGVAQQRCAGRKRLEVSRGEKGQRFCVDPADRRGENRLGCAS